MNWDVLLHWMTHLGEGSWNSFRKAVNEFVADESESREVCRKFRTYLSELGHVDFFIGGTPKWQVRKPILGQLLSHPEVAVLCGGRTPDLLSNLQNKAVCNQCHVSITLYSFGLSEVSISGAEKGLQKTASELGITFVPRLAESLCEGLLPTKEYLDQASDGIAPINWSVRSYDFDSLSWVDRELPNTAIEYYQPYGDRIHFVLTNEGKLIRVPKREAVYAAAALRRTQIVSYDAATQSLKVPVSAPLPEDFSRVACLTSGRPSRYQGEHLIYESVVPHIVAQLLIKAGQPFPDLRWCKSG